MQNNTYGQSNPTNGNFGQYASGQARPAGVYGGSGASVGFGYGGSTMGPTYNQAGGDSTTGGTYNSERSYRSAPTAPAQPTMTNAYASGTIQNKTPLVSYFQNQPIAVNYRAAPQPVAGAQQQEQFNQFSGGMFGVSDEREKAVSKMDAKAEDFLSNLGAHKYQYKHPEDPGAGFGTYISPMAQEIEKSELGKMMVKETPDGKKIVDYGKGFGAMLAGMAYLNKKVEKMEKKK
jgi:hypothetical protein